MVVSGEKLIKNNIVRNFLDKNNQTQPCGVDLTLKQIICWKSAGIIDFDNSKRKLPEVDTLAFDSEDMIHLQPGAYLIEFNETVDVPLTMMGEIFVRSSLFRSGALISAGLMDAGYVGAIGALLQVVNPYGITLQKNAKLAQYAFYTMEERLEKGYRGIYHNSGGVI